MQHTSNMEDFYDDQLLEDLNVEATGQTMVSVTTNSMIELFCGDRIFEETYSPAHFHEYEHELGKVLHILRIEESLIPDFIGIIYRSAEDADGYSIATLCNDSIGLKAKGQHFHDYCIGRFKQLIELLYNVECKILTFRHILHVFLYCRESNKWFFVSPCLDTEVYKWKEGILYDWNSRLSTYREDLSKLFP